MQRPQYCFMSITSTFPPGGNRETHPRQEASFPTHAVRAPLLHVQASRPAHSSPGRLWSAHSRLDRKSTRLNSSHLVISYAVFCLKKKKQKTQQSSVQSTN